MLTPSERDVLPRLSVFAGSFGRAAAEYVAGAPLPLLAALVDKSLLRADGNGRFSMHSLLRQCAAERLDARDQMVARHAEHYAQLLARRGDASDSVSLTEIDLEWSNCRAAWRESVRLGLASNIERMARPLWDFFNLRGRVEEGIALMEEALQGIRAADQAGVRARANAQWSLAFLLVRQTRLTEAEAAAREALRQFTGLHDKQAIVGCLYTLGTCLWQRGDYEAARRCFDRGLRRSRADGVETQVHRLEAALAVVEEALGRYDRALERHMTALAMQRSLGDLRAQLGTLNNMAVLLCELRRPAEALPFLKEGRELCRQKQCSQYEPFFLSNLARAYIQLNELSIAENFASQASVLAQERGTRQAEIEARLMMAKIALGNGQHDAALERIRDHLRMTQDPGCESWQLSALAVYAALLAALGQRVRAAAHLNLIIADPRSLASERVTARDDLERMNLSEGEQEEVASASADLSPGRAVAVILSGSIAAGPLLPARRGTSNACLTPRRVGCAPWVSVKSRFFWFASGATEAAHSARLHVVSTARNRCCSSNRRHLRPISMSKHRRKA